jgi:hypothetical protein
METPRRTRSTTTTVNTNEETVTTPVADITPTVTTTTTTTAASFNQTTTTVTSQQMTIFDHINSYISQFRNTETPEERMKRITDYRSQLNELKSTITEFQRFCAYLALIWVWIVVSTAFRYAFDAHEGFQYALSTIAGIFITYHFITNVN